MLSLTSMWVAEKADPSRKPSEWLRSAEAIRFLKFLADTLGVTEVGKNHFGLVKTSRGGKDGGVSFAHWQIGLAYAMKGKERLLLTHLSAVERAEHTARRKELYEALHPETALGAFVGNQHKSGVRHRDEPQIDRFTKATAEATGQSERALIATRMANLPHGGDRSTNSKDVVTSLLFHQAAKLMGVAHDTVVSAAAWRQADDFI